MSATLITLTCLAVMIVQTQQTTMCQTTFLTQFYTCIHNVHLLPQNILWFTKNGTLGTKPVDEQAFKESACRQRLNVYNCSVTAMDHIVNSSACADSDKTLVKKFFGSIFGPYDVLCAHPCRHTLFSAFRRCHDKIGITFGPFLTKENIASVIGSNTNETAQFCMNRGKLLSCMSQEKTRCPEADFVMRQAGLDLNVIRKSTQVFCSYPQVYLDSVVCSQKLSSEVRRCYLNAEKKMANLTSEFQIIINEKKFNDHFCAIRQENVLCDVMAWSKKADDRKCNEAVIGLRIEYGCKLLPDQCTSSFSSEIKTLCSSEKFMQASRQNYGNGSARLGHVSVPFLVSVLIMLNI